MIYDIFGLKFDTEKFKFKGSNGEDYKKSEKKEYLSLFMVQNKKNGKNNNNNINHYLNYNLN